ncbi:MAG: hypothetical protein KF788_03065 [Piscinibacter sp.]|nr:hypothetical protein [Piscinibacter sp.]
MKAALVLVMLGAMVLSARAQLRTPRPPPAEPQSLAELIDSLSDNALTGGRSQFYRVDGTRRIVRLGRGWSAVFDEQATSRLASAGDRPGTAGPPGKAIELLRQGEHADLRLYTLRDSTGRDGGGSFVWHWGDGWQARAQALQLDDDGQGLKRRDAELALRRGGGGTWAELLWRRASVQDLHAEAPDDAPQSANFAGARVQWQPENLPGLTLQALAQRRAGPAPDGQDERVFAPRAELGAEYRFEHPALPDARLYWTEAVRLGLLSSDGLALRDTYRRVIGGEVGDGSPDGRWYLQWRDRGLLDDRNALAVAGWRHGLQPAPRWRLQTLIEHAAPAAGPSPVRSTTLGARLTQSAWPHHSLLAETELVRSSVQDSAYLGLKLNQRLTENTLGAWRFTVTDKRPHEGTEVPATELKASVGWGWREPVERRWHTLARLTRVDRESHRDDTGIVGASDRRAYIALGHVGWQATEDNLWTLRHSRRHDRDDAFEAGATRRTDLSVLRLTHAVTSRWSISAHAAQRRDDVDPTRRGLGAEIGYRIGSKAALALGWNPRGIDDEELALDDKLERGLTLRLRFSIEAVLARWLDAPMAAVRAAADD